MEAHMKKPIWIAWNWLWQIRIVEFVAYNNFAWSIHVEVRKVTHVLRNKIYKNVELFFLKYKFGLKFEDKWILFRLLKRKQINIS